MTSIPNNITIDGIEYVRADTAGGDPEPWVPKVGDRVLVEALVVEKSDPDGDVGVRTRWRDGSEPFSRVDPDTLRPFPEDGEA